MSLPILPQPAAGGRLCRAGADTVAKRIGAARSGRIQVGQPEAAIHHDPAGLAMAAAPADVGVEPLVSRAREANGGRGKKTSIVALARKLLVAFWKFSSSGVVIEGAAMKAA